MRPALAAVTSFRHRPVLTLAMVLTLALGLGATTTAYSFVDALLLRPLPYPGAGDLVTVFETSPDDDRRGAAPANFLDWRRETPSMELAATFGSRRTLEGPAGAERVAAASVSGNYFALLGGSAAAGRTFQPAEDEESGVRRAVLSDALWRRMFGADPSIVGRNIRIDEQPYEVVGVMSQTFRSPFDEAELWTLGERGVPLIAGAPDLAASRDVHYFTVLGRLAPNVSTEGAQDELARTASSLAARFPETNRDLGVNIVPLRDAVIGDRSATALLLLGAVGLVLLIAGANTANLMIAAAIARSREFAIRSALGATRAQVVTPVLVEGSVIAVVAGVVGLAGAAVAVASLTASGPLALPTAVEATVDLRVALAALALAAVVGALASMAPAMRAGSGATYDALRGGRSVAGSRREDRLQRSLASAQVGLSLTLLVGAGLLLQSYRAIARVDPGFRGDGLLAMDAALSRAAYGDAANAGAYFERAIAAAGAVPGVAAATAISNLPLSDASMNRGLRIEGRPEPERGTDQTIDYQVAAAGYFEAMGIPLRAGRSLAASDAAEAPPVAVINEAARRRYWPDVDPLGTRVAFTRRDGRVTWPTIVGIVGDVRHFGLDEAPRPEIFVPMPQDPARAMSLVVRVPDQSRDARAALQGALHRATRAIDPTQPVSAPRAMADLLAASTAGPRLLSRMLVVFATVALLLASVGLYGLLAQLVQRRTRELGVRLALGALPRQVLALVMRDAMRLVGAGIVIGLVGAIALTRIIRASLFGTLAAGPEVFIVTVSLLVVVASLAAFIPARRASQLEPARVIGAGE